MPDSDPDSFIILTNEYSKDKNHVYFREKLIKNADPATFILVPIADREVAGADKNGIYLKEQMVKASTDAHLKLKDFDYKKFK